MTVNEIMDIVSDYGQELKDYGHTESSGSTFSLIRTAIEELHRKSDLKTLAAKGCGDCFPQDREWPKCVSKEST